GSLERLNERWMIVRFDLEGASPSVANVDDAGVFSGALQDAFAARRQPLQVNTRRFVGAVFAPHHAEDAQFSERGFAAAEKLLDLLVFVERKAMLPDGFRGKSRGQRSRHGEPLLSHFGVRQR